MENQQVEEVNGRNWPGMMCEPFYTHERARTHTHTDMDMYVHMCVRSSVFVM